LSGLVKRWYLQKLCNRIYSRNIPIIQHAHMQTFAEPIDNVAVEFEHRWPKGVTISCVNAANEPCTWFVFEGKRFVSVVAYPFHVSSIRVVSNASHISHAPRNW
jgi:hypothetical protein